MEPFLSPVLGDSEKRLQAREKRNEFMKKRDRMQILPGVFELISYNKFLVIQFENLVGNINPFKANKEIVSLCGREPKIRSQGDGSLVIEVSSPEESERLMEMTKLVGHNVKCIPHPTFNQCRGVIYAPELLSIDADEIQSELEEQNVIKVVRMMKKDREQLIPLPTLVLTFKTYKMPNTIKAGWLNFKVKPFIPSPLRCYHCHMYGHSIQKCRKRMNQEPSVCVNCGKDTHGECKENPKCINCGEMHPASSKSCIRYIYEKEVQAIRVIEKVSFREARKKAMDRQIRPGESFSSVIKKAKTNINQENQLKLPSCLQPNADIPPAQQDSQEASSEELPNLENPTVMKKKATSNIPVKTKSLFQTSPSSKDTPSTSGLQDKQSRLTLVNSKSTPARSDIKVSSSIYHHNKSRKKKRERTPDENSYQNDKDSGISSQNSTVVPRNQVKLKRIENK